MSQHIATQLDTSLHNTSGHNTTHHNAMKLYTQSNFIHGRKQFKVQKSKREGKLSLETIHERLSPLNHNHPPFNTILGHVD